MHAERYSAGLDAAGADAEYFEGYGDVRVHAAMLRDRPRVAAYRDALARAPLRGRSVIDVGAGCGILSLLAARAGARRVWAVEASPVAGLLRRVVDANGLGGVITVVPRRVEELTKADVGGGADAVVSEWMGFYLVHESMLASVVAARDTLVNPLGPGGKLLPWQVLPCAATIWVAPVDLSGHLAEAVGVWSSEEHTEGFDLSPFTAAAAAAAASEPLVEQLPADCLLAEPERVAALDLVACRDADTAALCARAAFAAVAAGREVHGFALWFDVRFDGGGGGGTALGTGPRDAATHWKQTTVVLPQPVPAHVRPVVAEVELDRDEDNPRCYALSISVAPPDGGGAEGLLRDAMAMAADAPPG